MCCRYVSSSHDTQIVNKTQWSHIDSTFVIYVSTTSRFLEICRRYVSSVPDTHFDPHHFAITIRHHFLHNSPFRCYPVSALSQSHALRDISVITVRQHFLTLIPKLSKTPQKNDAKQQILLVHHNHHSTDWDCKTRRTKFVGFCSILS